jgi:GAF domain-containing protein
MTRPDNALQARGDQLAVVAGITRQMAGGRDEMTVLTSIVDGCAALMAAEVGIMSVDPRGGIDVVAVSAERAALLELLQVQADEGPCVDCIREGRVVPAPDLNSESGWQVFTPIAIAAGYRAAHAFPLTLDGVTVGGLNLLHTEPTQLNDADIDLVSLFADLAVLTLTQDETLRRSTRLAEHTLAILNDRIQLAQAIGLVAGRLDIEPEQARSLVEAHSRGTGLPVRDLAEKITSGELDESVLVHDDGDR